MLLESDIKKVLSRIDKWKCCTLLIRRGWKWQISKKVEGLCLLYLDWNLFYLSKIDSSLQEKRPQENITSFSLIWRSDAAANVRRQGCKSLTNAHCLVSQHLLRIRILFWHVLHLCEYNLCTRECFWCSRFQSRAKDSCFFTLKCFDGSMHHFKVSPQNDPEATRKVCLFLLWLWRQTVS